MFDIIAFDADDTLWHNEPIYLRAQERFRALLAGSHPAEAVDQALHKTEMRNLDVFGYGIKPFVLSMVEAAIALTEGHISGQAIQRIIDLGREMLQADIMPLDGARETVARLAGTHRLMIVTKGDPLDQHMKLERSGLGGYFQHVEVVHDKTAGTYAALLSKYRVLPERFLMVGNALRSDILPVLAVGGWAVYVPYEFTWAHENAPGQEIDSPRYFEIAHLGLLPDLVERLSDGGG